LLVVALMLIGTAVGLGTRCLPAAPPAATATLPVGSTATRSYTPTPDLVETVVSQLKTSVAR